MKPYPESVGTHGLDVAARGAEVLVLRGCVPQAKCDVLEELVGSLHFEPATVRSSSTQSPEDQHLHRPRIRQNLRARVSEPILLEVLYDILADHLSQLGPAGVTVPLTVYRYLEGDFFGQHRDGTWRFAGEMRSTHTLLLCLVSPSVGGATLFPAQRAHVKDLEVALGRGDVLVFPHGLLHRACAVERGEKLLLRTNVVSVSPTSE